MNDIIFVHVCSLSDTLNSKADITDVADETIYSGSGFRDDRNRALPLSKIPNKGVLELTMYASSVASSTRIKMIIPNNPQATYAVYGYGTNVYTLRSEIANGNFTILSVSQTEQLYVDSIVWKK